MLEWLWLVPALPLAGFVVLFATRGELSRPAAAVVGAGSVGAAAVVAGLVAVEFLAAPPPGGAFEQTLWSWIRIGAFEPAIAFHLDALAVIMMLVVTVVGFLIHVYSTEYMIDDDGYARYFAAMNLFVSAMLVLVLAEDLLFLYLGWEGVGLCSYLLIGFWYRDPANGLAARKAFVMTRVGDTALLIGLLLLFTELGTLEIQTLTERAAAQWVPDSPIAIAAAALLLAGAVGKSAQLPLQTWLPDAMAGPTPVSALIHAATMVTAGMYLIARAHELFALAPTVQLAVAVIGVLTLLLAGCSALVQKDIKRILAYSTISQIGYMFLALGVGAWSAAVFHFMTHAFFKALLFLAAGAVIVALHDEHDIHRMGGLRRRLPHVFWSFLIGAAALASLPLVTAGFYSKDQILWAAWASASGGPWLWLAGALGAFVTALYSFRLVFVAFFGEAATPVSREPGPRMMLPVFALALLSVIGGFVEVPHTLGGVTLLTDFLHTALPAARLTEAGVGLELALQLIAAVASLGGIALAWLLFRGRREATAAVLSTPAAAAVSGFWRSGWGFDWLYERVVVRPFVRVAWSNRDDVVDGAYDAAVHALRHAHGAASRLQNGELRWYAAGIALGAVLVVAVAVF